MNDQSSENVFRLCYAAAHVVMKDDYAEVPHRHDAPGDPETIAEYVDWDATMGVRTHLDSLGYGIAEAMDTAQRFSLGWTSAKQLIERCAALNLQNGFVAGAGYDQSPNPSKTSELIDAVIEQAMMIEDLGGEVILLPMPWLTANNADPGTYVKVYTEIIRPLRGPIFTHWLGEAFMPALKGYFPGESFYDIMAIDPSKIRGAKISLLDLNTEREIRSRLLQSDQIVLTGDDFNFGNLIKGENTDVLRTTTVGSREIPIGHFSHALLGILDAVAEPVSRALEHLEHDNTSEYDDIMMPCEELGRWIFQEPTQFYKSGLAFLSWLNGLQDNPMLINHEELNRDAVYYKRTAELAQQAGCLSDSVRTKQRLNQNPRSPV